MADGIRVGPAFSAGYSPASFAIPAIAQGLAGVMRGRREGEQEQYQRQLTQDALARQKDLEDLKLLVDLHGANVVNDPTFQGIYTRITGRPWPTTPEMHQEVVTPAVPGQPAQVGAPARTVDIPSITSPAERGPGGAARPEPPQTVTITPEVPARPAVPGQPAVTREVETGRQIAAPLGGADQAVFNRSLLENFGEEKLKQLGVPQQFWKVPTAQAIKMFPELGKELFDVTAQQRGQFEFAKQFYQRVLTGDISGMSPAQLRFAIESYNSVVKQNPSWGLPEIPSSAVKEMIEGSVRYQERLGIINKRDADIELAQAKAQAIRDLTPERVKLIQAQVMQIQDLTPERRKLLGAQVQKALAQAKHLVENQGMTPYQAASLALRQNISDRRAQIDLIKAYSLARARSYSRNPLTGQMEQNTELTGVADALESLATHSELMLKQYNATTSRGPQMVTFKDVVELIGELKVNKQWGDADIARYIQQMGIPLNDFLPFLPGLSQQRPYEPGAGRK